MSYKSTINNLYRLAAEKTMIENIELVEKRMHYIKENKFLEKMNP